MSSKRAKLTADKARERIAKLEESIASRESKLEQLKARIARSSNPEEKLISAEQRLERRLKLEQEQVHKLKRLLHRRITSQQESGEYFNSEEIDDLHRSFEEVRQDLSKVKLKLDSTDIPRDLPGKLTSFEERMARREEADSDLFTQILSLQTTLDQERQTVRRLSRKVREQDQSLDALREAVEDSVVATVDLAERLDELEEGLSDSQAEEQATEPPREPSPEVLKKLSELADRLENNKRLWEEKWEALQENTEDANLQELLAGLERRLDTLEQTVASAAASPTGLATDPPPETEPAEWVKAVFHTDKTGGRVPAKFANGQST